MKPIVKNTKVTGKGRGFIVRVLIYFFILLSTIVGSEYFSRTYFKNKVSNNVYFQGINISGYTREKLDQLVGLTAQEYTSLEISVATEKYQLRLSDLNYKLDAEKNWQAAYTLKKDYLNNPLLLSFPVIVKKVTLIPIISYDTNQLSEEVEKIISLSSTKPVFEEIILKEGVVSVTPGKDGFSIDKEEAVWKVSQAILEQKGSVAFELHPVSASFGDKERDEKTKEANGLLTKKMTVKFEDESYDLSDSDLINTLNDRPENDNLNISKIVSEISNKFERAPKEPVFVFENGKVSEFSPSIFGVSVIKEELAGEIVKKRKALSESSDKEIAFDLPFTKTPSKINTEDVNSLGIKEKIGSGISYFKGSIASRIHNIKLASSKFNGVLIPPGETFSFNQTLGDVSKVTGYQPAYIIKDGQTILGDGGGVCQVSTTLFRAALDSGLPIVERRSHSYRVGYYEQGFPPGLDATVFDPTTDLKLKNDTDNHILIQTMMDESSNMLTFNLYGTDDGRSVTLSKPVITSSISPPEDLYIDDPTLKIGVVRQIDYKAWGAKVYFSYKVEREGVNIFEKIFYSNYQPWQAKYLRGTAP